VLYQLTAVRGIDPKITESFLLSQPSVVDASVWFLEGNLQAHVTVLDDAEVSRRSLQASCMEELGLHQTPRDILLIQARPKAA
jgi:hypothetical protein